MKRSTKVLQVTAMFPPALALVVGLSLFLRVQREDKVEKQLIASETVMNRANELDAATSALFFRPEKREQGDWLLQHAAVGQAVKEFETCGGFTAGDMERIRGDHAYMRTQFDLIVKGRQERGGSTNEAAGLSPQEKGLESQIMAKSRAVSSGIFRLAMSGYTAAAAAQQNSDSLIIIFSSILAVLMAIAAYAAVKDELLERSRVGETLRKTDVRLSDAIIKLKRAREQAGQQERLHALELAARWAVHEYRNMLVPILSNVEIMQDLQRKKGGGAPENMECMEMIERSARRIDEATDRLDKFLHVGRVGVSVDMNKVVEEALLATRTIWKDRSDSIAIKIKTELTRNIPPVEGDETDMNEAIMNVFLNAAEAMPDGGTLSIRTQADGGWVAVEISDTGVGMSEEVRRLCVEPFFSTKGPGAAGTGLTAVDSIVRRHQGTLDIESKQGVGTTVVICFPEKQTVTATKMEGDVLGKHPTGLRVLVVDDESWSRTHLAKQLVADGHMVDTAASGTEGLEKFLGGVFDVVVTDRAMPDMSGEELAEAVKRHNPAKPVILATGFVDSASLGRQGERKNIDVVVNKPIALNDIRLALLKVSEHKKQ